MSITGPKEQLGPPENISDEALVAYLLERPAPSRVVPFPAKEGEDPRAIAGQVRAEVRIVLVDPIEVSKAKAKTIERIRGFLQSQAGKREIDSGDMNTRYANEMYNDWLTAEMVSLCTWSVQHVNADPSKPIYKRLFPHGAPQVMDPKRGGLYSDEIAILFTKYMVAELELGPRNQVLFANNDSFLNMWIEKLKRGMWSLDPFSSLAFQDLAELCSAALQRLDKAVRSGSVTLDLPYLSSPDTSESSPTESE